MESTVAWVTATFAFCSLICGLSAWLDKQLGEEFKSAIVHRVFGRSSDSSPSTKKSIGKLYTAIESIYNFNKRSSFIRRAIFTSIIFIVILILLQYIFNNENFLKSTLPFIERMVTLDIRVYIFFIGILTIDVISIYQTLLFMRIARSCENVVEFLFVSFADLVMSFIVFIVVIPFFITSSFLFSQNKDSEIEFVLSTVESPKSYSTYDAIRDFLVFDPRKTRPSEVEVDGEVRQKGWNILYYSVLARTSNTVPLTIGDIVKTSTNSYGMIIQMRGLSNLEEAAFAFREILAKSDNVSTVKSLDFYDNFLGGAYDLLKVNTNYTTGYKFFVSNYFSIMKEINFFDENLLKVIKLGKFSIDENEIYQAYNVKSALSLMRDEKRRYYIYCDGKITHDYRPKEVGVDTKYDDCKKALAVNAYSLQGILHIATYKFSNNIGVPISPFALSSLIATILFYYIALCFIITSLLFSLSAPLFKERENFFVKNPLLITSIALSALVIFPVSAAIHFGIG